MKLVQNLTCYLYGIYFNILRQSMFVFFRILQLQFFVIRRVSATQPAHPTQLYPHYVIILSMHHLLSLYG